MIDAPSINSHLTLSRLPHTWLIDIDGTIFAHNPRMSGDYDDIEVGTGDVLLPGVADFWKRIPVSDTVILLSARHPKYRSMTEHSLQSYGLRYNEVIFGLPKGERLLLNDIKPGGLLTAHAVNLRRDGGLSEIAFHIDDNL